MFGLSRVVSWVFSAVLNTFTLFYKVVAPEIKPSLPPQDICNVVRKANAICFDVDSTVINDEGIVSLAEICGVKEDVEKMYANKIMCFQSNSFGYYIIIQYKQCNVWRS